jgi:hypothetical protein
MDQHVKDNGDSRGDVTPRRRFAESVLAQIDPAELHRYRWYGFKAARMIGHVGPLMETFPGGRFVHLIRDPRTAFPAKASPEADLDGFLDAWAQTHLPVWRTYRESSRYRLVRYEELVTSPEETIRSLFDWLAVGETGLPAALSIARRLPSTLNRKRAVEVSRIRPAVEELGYG